MIKDFNLLIIYITLGAVLLATGYHTVLFINNRTRLLRSYCIYLFTILCYTLFCVLRVHQVVALRSPLPDELLQMLCCIMYARFLRVAIAFGKDKHRRAKLFVQAAPFITAVYLLLLYFALKHAPGMVLALMGGIRVYFFVAGLYLLVITLRQLHSQFYYYLGAGALVLIGFAIVSTLVEYYFLQGHPVRFRGLTWLLTGFVIEIIFYSAAVGYRTKRESLLREAALQKVVDQNDIIRQHEVDKVRNAFLAKEEERSRIVKDIHDELGSAVSAISILANIISNQAGKKDVQPMLQELQTIAAGLADRVDDIVWSMNPQFDLLESLLLRIKQYATPLFEAAEIDYHFNFRVDAAQHKTDTRTRQYMYYIVKEAINNLLKYSGCTEAWISAAEEGENLVFSIRDNGYGFLTDAAEGNGLHFMQQRAAAIGAQFSIETAPGKGTTITVRTAAPSGLLL